MTDKPEKPRKTLKKFEFVNEGAAQNYLALPKDMLLIFGADLHAVQQDEAPASEHKVLTATVGPGAIELIQNGSPAFRVVYCCKYMETVFVLHAFTKTTNGVDQKELRTAKKRYKLMKEIVDEAAKAEKTAAKAPKKHR